MARTPIRICSAPGDWALRGDPLYLHHLCTTPTGTEQRLPDLVMVTEAKDYDMKKALHDTGLARDWTGLQKTDSPAQMGCAIAVNVRTVTIRHWGQTEGVTPTVGGRHFKMLTRYPTWLSCTHDGQWYFGVAIHNAPGRFAVLQPIYNTHVRALLAGHPNGFTAGDYNQSLDDAAKALGLRVAGGEGIVGVLRQPTLKTSDVVVSRWGIGQHYADHPATSLSLQS